MKKISLSILASLLCLGALLCVGPTVYAVTSDDGSAVIETNLLGNIKDDGKGCGVYMIII